MSFPQIDGYQIITKVGEGAMSEVFLANNQQGTAVAIKVLRHFFKDRESYVTRLKKEAQTMSLLKDERIVKCLEVVKTKEAVPALVCEFVDGKNLEELHQKKCHPLVAANIIAEVLLGLEESHRQGIVHRDLKPENILLTKSGRIKITDFGVAKNLESQEMTVTGLVMGSPAYMSPEQIYGESIDERSDLYALGVMLYYFSTGVLPFTGESYGELSQKVLKGKYLSPEKVNPQLHPHLVEIIHKALNKSPFERYQKAYEFRYDLMRWMDELCLPSSQEILQRYYEGLETEFLGKDQLVQTLIGRAKKAKVENRHVLMTQHLQQVLTLDPSSTEARDLLNRKDSVIRYSLVFVALITLLTVFFNFQRPSENLAIKPNELEVFDIENLQSQKFDRFPNSELHFFNPYQNYMKSLGRAKKVNKDVVVHTKAAVQKIETGVQFFVDTGVDVYLDGEKILNLNRPFLTSAGSHDVMLVKPGFNPITSKIYVVKNQITKINAR